MKQKVLFKTKMFQARMPKWDEVHITKVRQERQKVRVLTKIIK